MAFILVNGVILAFLVLHATDSVVLADTQVKTVSVNEVVNQADPYDDPYNADPYDDPYNADPYDDPYNADPYDDPYNADGLDPDENLGQRSQVVHVNQAALEALEDRAEERKDPQEFLLMQKIKEEPQKPKQ